MWPSDELSQLNIDLVKPINFYSLSLYIRYTNTFQPSYRFDQCTNIFFPILTIELLLKSILCCCRLYNLLESLVAVPKLLKSHNQRLKNELDRKVLACLFVHSSFLCMLQYASSNIQDVVFALNGLLDCPQVINILQQKPQILPENRFLHILILAWFQLLLSLLFINLC